MLTVNWFSPLPPAQSGIANNFTLQVLPALARHYNVVLWTDQPQVSPGVQQMARVVRYDPAAPPWREINNGAVSFYHMGNHPDFHSGIWQISQRHPGVVVLHDVCLHDFFFMFWVHNRKDRQSYLAALSRWYGEEGRRAGEAFCAGGVGSESMTQRFPLTRQAVQGALGAITHSSLALKGEIPGCPLAELDHPYVAASDSQFERWLAARHAAPRPPYRLVIFGYLSRNRRLEAILEALAGIPGRNQFRLDICGQLWDESHIRTRIEQLRLGHIVNVHGFLPASEVEHTLSTADLALNLRYPSMGEASGSQLQFWDYGLPSLVTRTGWYASLPEDAAAFVRPEHEMADIQAHLSAFLADPAAFKEMGRRGRLALANHDPEKYIAAMMQFAGEALRRAARVPALALAQHVGADLGRWLHPAGSEYLLERASQAITQLVENDCA